MNPLRALSILCLLALCACGSSTPETWTPPRRQFATDAQREQAAHEFAVYDPAQGVNRHIYKFNAEADRYVLIPIVDAYTYVTPVFLRRRVSDFFLNVAEVTNFTNAILQLAPKKAGMTLGRFALNTTIGLLGTFDVATGWGLQRQPEDFGKTLGHWGASPGAYIVLPLLGPSNARDTVGQIVDYATLTFLIPPDIRDTAAYDALAYGLQPINLRYSNDFRYFSSGSPFEYELVRYITTQVRTLEIEKEKHQ